MDEKAKELLESNQWSRTNMALKQSCPICWEPEENGIHDENCWLAQVLSLLSSPRQPAGEFVAEFQKLLGDPKAVRFVTLNQIEEIIAKAHQACDLLAAAEEEKKELQGQLDWWGNLVDRFHDNEKCSSLRAYIEQLEAKNAELQQQLVSRDKRIEELEKEVAEWENMRGNDMGQMLAGM